MKNNKVIRSVSFILFFVLLIVPCFSIVLHAENYSPEELSNLELYVGGMPFGVKIVNKGLTVVKFSNDEGDSTSAALEGGIKIGDIIVKINNKTINSIEDFSREVDSSGGQELKIEVIRNGKPYTFYIKPKYCKDDGKYKTGVWVKDSTTGIGTITFINPKTCTFGGLGHGICDSSSGRIIPVTKGLVMNVDISGSIKGTKGSAGELKGSFLSKKIGTLLKNSDCGVFGILSSKAVESPEGKMKIGTKEEIKEGKAYIWSTVDEGVPEKYQIEISSIDKSNSSTKNFKIKVTDKKLLEKTGGIVQGMSGSPIIQNGKLVGAVTHVLINDPTEGYGIFIENMLNTIPEILK